MRPLPQIKVNIDVNLEHRLPRKGEAKYINTIGDEHIHPPRWRPGPKAHRGLAQPQRFSRACGSSVSVAAGGDAGAPQPFPCARSPTSKSKAKRRCRSSGASGRKTHGNRPHWKRALRRRYEPEQVPALERRPKDQSSDRSQSCSANTRQRTRSTRSQLHLRISHI